MTLFLVANTANVAQLEGLVVAAARPPGNKQKPKIGQDLRRTLRQYLRRDAQLQIDNAVYPERQSSADPLVRRITTKKLRAVSQERLARVLAPPSHGSVNSSRRTLFGGTFAKRESGTPCASPSEGQALNGGKHAA